MKNIEWAALLFLLAPSAGISADVEVVLGSEAGPYRQAFDGFKESFGRPDVSFGLAEKISKFSGDVKVVVAFGGKAAILPMADQSILVYALAPGVDMNSQRSKGRAVKIHMEPSARVFLKSVKEIQPNMRKLGVIWISESFREIEVGLRELSSEWDVELYSEKMADAKDLPDCLRRMKQKGIEALWLPPDPLLVNPQSFQLIKEFSLNHRIPFYAPTSGLMENGAYASISVSYTEIGRSAARAVKDVLAGKPLSEKIYAENTEIVINKSLFISAGWPVPIEVLKRAKKVIP